MGNRIVSAAIKYKVSDEKTVVIPCLRHIDGYQLIEQIGLPQERIVEEGFVDEDWNYHSRKEAYEIAVANGQVQAREDYQILFSEDIY